MVLIKHKNYSIEAVDISLDEILKVLNKTTIIEEPKIAFPQANSFKRVINLCELLAGGEKSSDDITLNYAFEPRQTNYYTDAGRYLGLINKSNGNRTPIYSLSEEGRRILRLKYKAKQLKFVELILEHNVFQETLKRFLDYGEMPSKNEIVNIMKASNLFRVGADDTYERRASSVAGWVNWILKLQNI